MPDKSSCPLHPVASSQEAQTRAEQHLSAQALRGTPGNTPCAGAAGNCRCMQALPGQSRAATHTRACRVATPAPCALRSSLRHCRQAGRTGQGPVATCRCAAPPLDQKAALQPAHQDCNRPFCLTATQRHTPGMQHAATPGAHVAGARLGAGRPLLSGRGKPWWARPAARPFRSRPGYRPAANRLGPSSRASRAGLGQ